MNFIDAVKSVFNNFANFNGRARRSEYWYFVLFSIIIRIPLTLAFNNPVIDVVIGLALLVPSIAVGVRRMHDVGKSGWFLLIPIYNLILACTDSQPGDNEYGPNPKTGISQEDLDSFGKQDVN